ncbi:MAG: DUF4363 family protein [Clostridia bacterium]
MRRAILLIVTLSLLGVSTGLWVDLKQRDTAREYANALFFVREHLTRGELENALNAEAYLHASWQHDVQWINCLTGHHHTRAVSMALRKLATALANGWQDEALRALDEAEEALYEIEASDFPTLQNVL